MSKRNTTTPPKRLSVRDLVFVGLGTKVLALCRYSGELIWEFKFPHGAVFTAQVSSILIEDDRLIVGSSGYLYCLEPERGGLIWENPLRGHGVQFTTLTSVNAVGRSDAQPVRVTAATAGG